jgi:hypothetical protein
LNQGKTGVSRPSVYRVKTPAVAAAEKHQGAALSKTPFVLVGGSKPPLLGLQLIYKTQFWMRCQTDGAIKLGVA